MENDVQARYDDCCRRLKVLSPSPLQPAVASALGEALRSSESIGLAGLQCIAACGRGETRRNTASTRKLIAAVPAAEDFLKQPRQAAAAVAACWHRGVRLERLASWEAPVGAEVEALAGMLQSGVGVHIAAVSNGLSDSVLLAIPPVAKIQVPTIDAMLAAAGLNSNAPARPNVIATELHGVVGNLSSMLNQLQEHGVLRDSTINRILQRLFRVERDFKGSIDDVVEWALSRYSPTERLPYRRLAHRPMQLLSLVARDAAEVSGAMDDEELASIAVNIVAAAGVDVGERHSVLHWLGLVCAAPQFGAAERAAPISEPLLRAEGAPEPEWTGLPISLGWHRVANKGRIDADDLHELCAVDPDAVIDLGDLLTWMVREQVIGKRLQAEAKP